MDFEKLRLFETVVEAGSFQKAAKKYYVSQRAVSQSMKKLEQELNLQLFMRENNKIVVTQVGQEFYLKVKDIIHSFDISVRGLQNQTVDPYHELKIGYFSPFEGNLLAKQLVNIKKLDPSINYKVTEESIEHLISDVKLGILDCAYILEYGKHSEVDKDLAIQAIYENQMVIGVSLLNSNANLTAFPISELYAKPILYYSPEESHYLKKEFLSSLSVSSANIHLARVSALEQMQMIVALDQAIAYYPNGLIQNVLSKNNLIKFMPLEANTHSQTYRISCIYDRKHTKKEVRKFLKLVH